MVYVIYMISILYLYYIYITSKIEYRGGVFIKLRFFYIVKTQLNGQILNLKISK